MPGRTSIVTALVLLATLMGSCSNALSKQEYVRRANRICREANERSGELRRPSAGEDLGPFIDKASDITNDMIAELRALEPPPEDQDRIDRMLDNLEQAAGYFPEIKEAAQSRDLARFEDLARKVGRSAGEAERIASEYGLDECRSDPVVPTE